MGKCAYSISRNNTRFSLYYDRKNLNTWTTENRIYLMDSSIKRYETDLEALRTLENHINRKMPDASGYMAAAPGVCFTYSSVKLNFWLS